MKAKLSKIVLLALMLVIAFSAFTPQSAYAGTNGQQLVVTVPVYGSATVKGYNQNGQYVTGYWKTGQWVGNRWEFGAVATFGWWWVGKVDIFTNTGKHCTANIPKTQKNDFVNVYCR
jgi:hypothetical protein